VVFRRRMYVTDASLVRDAKLTMSFCRHPRRLQVHHDRGDHGSFSGSFHPSRAGYSRRYDTGAWHQHQTPGLSSGLGLGSGSFCPRCGSPSYGQGAMADEWGSQGRDPYTQRRPLRCSACGFVPTSAPYSQAAGTGPMSPADDFYNDRPFDSFSNHHSRADWQHNPGGGGFDTQFNDMAFPRPISPTDKYSHRNQGPFPSSGGYDFQDPYPTMGGDAYDRGFGNQGFSAGGGDPYSGFPGAGMSRMSGSSRRGIHSSTCCDRQIRSWYKSLIVIPIGGLPAPFPRNNNLVTSYHYSKRVYLGGNHGGMGRSFGREYDNGMW
jgi:hypothetical protein